MATIKEQPSAINRTQAEKWFRKETKSLMNEGRLKGKIPALADQRGMAGQMVGKMMYFRYNPAFKADLPYYDIFPLIIIIQQHDKYMTGLNLHYIPVEFRVELLANLFDIITNVKFNADTRLSERFTYSYLQSLKKLRWFRPCIKNYRYNNIVTIPKVVRPAYWHRAVLLENAIWKKAAPATVYQDSRRIWLEYS
jgi:hypothetical protein